jgi:CubicO group peptidase (beta-lactamase class C family)
MPLDMAAVDALIERARRDVDSGRLPAAQLALALDGRLVVNEAFGAATTDSRFSTFSMIKPVVSLVVMELAAEGLIDLHRPVADLLPSFGGNGKDRVTISQVLLHAGGFPHAPLRVEAWADRGARLEAYAGWHLTAEPGTGYEYHASAGHWVIADVITEVTGRHHADVVAERMLDPVGLPRMLAIDPAEQEDIVDLVSVGKEPEPGTYQAMFGVEPLDTEVTNENLEAFNDPGVRAAGNPGGGGIARAADLALWYQEVLNDDGTLLTPQVRTDALTQVRQNGVDWLGTPANRTHAFVLAGDDGRANYRGHGHGASPLTFGHSGAKGQIAAADPATGISYCYMTSGMERDDVVHGRRAIAIATRAIACVHP